MTNITHLKSPSNKRLLLAVFPILTLITSCAVNPQQDSEKLSLQELNEAVKEWDTLEPDVKRIIAMEKEMTELKGLLIKLTDEPVIAPLPVSKPINNKVTVVKKKVLAPKVKPQSQTISNITPKTNLKSITGWGVQIGAFSSLTDIKLAVNRFYQQFDNLQTTTSAYSESVTASGKRFFRLKIGPFNSFKLANQQCIQAKQSKIDCLPAQLSGTGILVK